MTQEIDDWTIAEPTNDSEKINVNYRSIYMIMDTTNLENNINEQMIDSCRTMYWNSQETTSITDR